MTPIIRSCFLFLVLMVLAGASAAWGSDKVEGPWAPMNLLCEYLANPTAVDAAHPRFTWELGHSERGQKQTAYRVIVSTDSKVESGTVWDSGRVASANSTQVLYAGNSLRSDTAYFWKVKWWDNGGRESAWSQAARFETGLLSPGDWKAVWIGGKNELRKEFVLDKKIRRARVHISGLGYCELRINGRRVGRNVLDPGWTTYAKRVLYSSYDVTEYLRQGPNVLAVMLGQGWFKSRALLLQLNLEGLEGTPMAIVSDGSWKVMDGPVVADSVYDGETYDARLETRGWDQPGYDDKAWPPASLVQGPAGVLAAQSMPPIQVVDTIVPLKMTNPSPGVFIYDLGQNFSGWARLRVSGPEGTRVRMRFSELLYDDGRINTENLRGARAEDDYILRGEGEEAYEPRFTYHGFRYVEVTGFPGVPSLDSLRGRVAHSSVRQTGNFSCSNPLLNQIQRNIIWGQKSNLHSIPTDCCQRDERMGWMGDAHGTAEEALMNFDMAAFYTNFIRDIRDEQDDLGQITDTVPHIWGSRPADPAWGTAYPLIVWYLYKYMGDVRLVEEQYEGVKKYVEYLRTREEDGLVAYSYYGDWVSVEMTPGALVSAFFYLYDIEVVRDLARVLGREADVQTYSRLADRIRKKFREKYYDAKAGRYGTGTQTADALALFLEIPEEKERGGVFDDMRNNILYQHDTHLTTGIMGTKYIFDVLTRFGSSDLAYELAGQRTYPSWGYMVDNGATTLWELWQNKTGPSMNSHNHPMFGSVGAWFYKALAGIEPAEGALGFDKIRVAPQVVRDLRFASGSIRTLRGDVTVAWHREDKRLHLDVVVPVNSEAEITLPTLNLKNIVVQEGGRVIYVEQAFQPGVAGITSLKVVDSNLIINAGSGRYSFDLTGD